MNTKKLPLIAALVACPLALQARATHVGGVFRGSSSVSAPMPRQTSLDESELDPGASTGFSDVWTYEILSIEGSPITVGNIAVGLALLLIGTSRPGF